ncbi:MAG TPA: hypothetical protein VH437_21435 [Terriglobales bacterium]|jgi:hypothetical protein
MVDILRDFATQICTIALLCTCLIAQAMAPERKVEGHRLISDHDPKVSIELPRGVHYLGADRWILYDIADAELHAFVEANEKKQVQRLYWIQFEGYLPTKPDLHHTYDSPRHTELGGMDFYVDTWVRKQGEETKPGSDREHIEALIRSKGYHMPDGMMYVRMVHLLDEQKRKELMIIYGEDIRPSGFSADDLKEGGRAHDRWPTIETELIQRAKNKIKITK